MIGRPSPFLRINVRLPENGLVRPYLEAIGWDGGLDACATLVAEMRSLADGLTLCLDVADEVAPRLGMECHLSHQPPVEPRWKTLLDELVARGWCTPAKRDAILGWPGRVTPADGMGVWPARLVHAELRVPGDHFTNLEKLITHVKVTREPTGAVEAKAYFGFLHAWLRPELETDASVRKSPPSHSRSPGVSGAVDGATEFLLESRTRAGWWRDFSSFKDSDEWVSAYVAVVLSALPDPRAIDAARRTWELLVDRRRPTAGWGWNRRLPVDADSTGYVLRLAAALGLLGTPPAVAATRLLLDHAQPDGGLTTYLPETSPHLASRRIRSPNGSYDGWCRTSHPCVTAAAAPFAGERQLDFLRRVQRGDGSWEPYWGDDDEYATALAAEALAAADAKGDARRINAAVGWGIKREERVGESAFATAWCLRLALLRPDDAEARRSVGRAVRLLLDTQEGDGGWRASARLLAPRPDLEVRRVVGADTAATLDDMRFFTTATVLSALTRIPKAEV
jgi:hypothetical protein